MSDRVLIENLRPGMTITRITQQNGPVAIQKSGLISSDSMIQGLAEMGVQEVEIDPDLTVELAPKITHQTPTQALLRGHHDTAAKAVASMDSSLSDQFNRSLFLPTVQSLPSVWQQYAKDFSLFAVIMIGGLGLGFTAGSAERWWPVLTASFSVPQATYSKVSPSEGNPAVVKDEPAAEQRAGLSQSEPPEQPTAKKASADEAVGEAIQPTQITAVSEPEEKAVTLQTKSEPAYEGKVLNERVSNSVDVSPELLAKFNEAVKALDTENASQTQPPPSRVNVHSDVPRVDQLPVKLLTRLPSMNFSAHMYASNPRDRWVRVNGKQLGEGDWITDRVQIVNIEGQRVILNFEDELFSMAALTDW
ncbi:general secretion pathway protein GspB [Alteromonas ponticola]|uniref:General secretion pathway protein GspB n=1 Tax=Alteromonas aquimaris TaxID=2998417 RepID=A0ABT3P2F0_9ALTE|nr:general secretion pathway protein GspB [Alteromonas aquimaris]MCW8106938.1 general secretion pathway protein GspB [Alteromonas aquimaris]